MTLTDLISVIKWKWRLALTITLVSTLLIISFSFFSNKLDEEDGLIDGVDVPTATSHVVVNSQLGGVAGLARNQARVISNDTNIDIKIITDASPNTVDIIVSNSSDEEFDVALKECVNIANRIATRTADKAESFYADYSYYPYRGFAETTSISDEKVKLEVEDSKYEENSSDFKYYLKRCLIGIVGGLALSLCTVLCIDAILQPIHSERDIIDNYNITILDVLSPDDEGDRFFVNACLFLKSKDISQVCIIPVKSIASSGIASNALISGAKKRGADASLSSSTASNETIAVSECRPISDNVDALYVAQSADITIVTAVKMRDSMLDVQETLDELRLAGIDRLAFALIA